MQRRIGGGKEIDFGLLAETRRDRVLMNVAMADAVVCCVADAVVGEASLPDGEFGGEAVGEASLDESDGSFEGLLRGEKQVDVVGHDDEGVEFVDVGHSTLVLRINQTLSALFRRTKSVHSKNNFVNFLIHQNASLFRLLNGKNGLISKLDQ